jgi:ABC-type lipoprotein release transport system permease subunit
VTPGRLTLRSLLHHWRGSLAVVAGVAVAVSVLSGALLVGRSVRHSLRALVLERIGNTDFALSSGRFFREEVALGLLADPGLGGTLVGVAPLAAREGAATHEPSGRRAAGAAIYGVDARFWQLHGLPDRGPSGRNVLLSPALAEELGVEPGDVLLLRVQGESEVPGSSLFGRRDDLGRTLRVRFEGVLGPGELGEFSLRPHQQAVRAAFVPLALLQRSLDRRGEVNSLLIDVAPGEETRPEPLAAAARRTLDLRDLGLRLRPLPERGALSLESDSAMLADTVVEAADAAAAELGYRTAHYLTYLANAMEVGGRSVPYSLVTGLDPAGWAALAGDAAAGERPLLLNRWAADDLGAAPGDAIALEYLVWEEQGRLRSERSGFEVAGVVPLEGAAADPELAPEYPGITSSEHLSDWDPPFPIDLSRVRDVDEAYWDEWRTTPKAFVPLAAAQELWQHRLGRLTSLRVSTPEGAPPGEPEAFAAALRQRLDPLALGYGLQAVRQEGLQASRGATDFGEYFTYFSFFLIVAALLLASLFFRLGIEQRVAELGLLLAVGFPPRAVRRAFLVEGGLLALVGTLLGSAGAALWADLVLEGLGSFWIDAVGTTRLQLSVEPLPLLLGGSGGLLASLGCIAWTLRGLLRLSPRRLLAGALLPPPGSGAGRGARGLAWGGLGAGLGLLAAAAAGVIPDAGAFFGAGGALLVAALAFQWLALAGPPRPGAPPLADVTRLGLRSATWRPGRSLLCAALIAFATFVIVSVGAFRHEPREASSDPRSPEGGYALLAESVVPLHHDPDTEAGREALSLGVVGGDALEGVRFSPFRLRPGDDASCLNLYRPREPRILAPRADFLEAGRFSFQSSLAETPAERENPWRLLEREPVGGAIPVIADANSMAYVLHLGLGEVLEIPRPGEAPLRLRLVAALRTGLFQGELLMSEDQFRRAFPELDGYRFFLIDAPRERLDEVAAGLETGLVDFGIDVQSAAERLARFHRVENTYLATFQSLGALGLVLGTFGLATVLLRNALERRRELALLRAVGYRRRHLAQMALAENALLLGAGLVTGTGCALLAIAPAVVDQGGGFPAGSLAGLLVVVAATGLGVSALATAVVARSPLLASLRSE